MTESNVRAEDFDSTTAALNQGVRSMPLERANAEIEGWRGRLEASGDPALRQVAADLGRLQELLSAEELDRGAIARQLTELGDRAEAVAVSGTASPVADRLQLLSQLLTDQGRSMTEQVERSTTQGEAPGGRQ